MSSLPSLYPKSRSYTPGEFATKRFKSVSGAGTTRLYGSKPFDCTLDLEFQCSDDAVKMFFDNWYSAKGDFRGVRLPDEYFAGMRKDVFPCFLEWRWASEPDVSSVQPNLSRVRAKFVGVLEIR